jgi:16S rRNA (adenine1518-N6/adenine1519-N6)-dimethyltransferase
LWRRPTPGDEELRRDVFSIVDSAFGQRRKTLRTALGAALGAPARVDQILSIAGIDSSLRGEQIDLADFVAIAHAAVKVQ